MAEESSNPTQVKNQKRIAGALGSTRYVILLAVAGVFLGSMTLLILSTIEMISAVFNVFATDSGHGMSDLRIVLIEAVDAILVATVLYVIAIGLYQLFVNPHIDLPDWLHTDGLGDLERRLAGMSITVLSIIFVTAALESHGSDGNILGFGLATAAVIAAISFFLFQHGQHHPPHAKEKEHEDEA